MSTQKIELGATYKDVITGFEGVATGYVQYITGCNQALLVPPCDKSRKAPEACWYDEQRLSRTRAKVIAIDNGTATGCDAPAPIR